MLIKKYKIDRKSIVLVLFLICSVNPCYGEGRPVEGVVEGGINQENRELVLKEEVEIKDKGLREGLLEALGKEKWESIYKEELEGLEVLVLRNKGVKSIEGIGMCKNLKKLVLSNNEIEDIGELSKLKELTLLNIEGNKVEDISGLRGLKKLRQLSLYKNKIKEVKGLSELTNLEVLVLNDNEIEDISSLSGLTNITGFYAELNDIKDISVLENYKKLEILQLGGNKIKDIRPLKELKNLKQCSLRNQRLRLELEYINGEKLEIEKPKVYDREGNEVKGEVRGGYKEEGGKIVKELGVEKEKDIEEIRVRYKTEVEVLYGKVDYTVEIEIPYVRVIEGIDLKGGKGEKENPIEIEIKSLSGLKELLEVMPRGVIENKKPKIEGDSRVYELKREVEVGKPTYIKVKIDERNEEFKYIFESGYGVVEEKEEKEFKDIKGYWCEESIKEYVKKGYIKGYEDGTFRPRGEITRGEFVQIVNKVYGYTEKGEGVFKDIEEGAWYYEEVLKAEGEGYIKGYEDGTFRPNEKISREEVVKVLGEIEGIKDRNIDKLLKYRDSKEVSDWSKSEIEGMLEGGYIKGYEGDKLNPKGKITRGEVVGLLKKLEDRR